jgi:hypothetical protein
MPLTELISRLTALQAKGATRAYVKDATNLTIFDVIDVELDADNDVVLLAD